MLGRISYPMYPQSFKIRRKLFNDPAEEINSFIKESIRYIILELEIGMIKDDAIHSLDLDKTKVSVIYKSGSFSVMVEENGKTYIEPIETSITLQPIKSMEELYFKMKSEFNRGKLK